LPCIAILSCGNCFSEVPERMPSTSAALEIFVVSISTLQLALVLVLEICSTTVLSDCHMECLGLIMFVVVLVYVEVTN
jgi:hypothetical protein